MMLFSDTKLRPVVTTTTAITLGRVEDVLVDPRTQCIVALRVRSRRGHEVLHWPEIAGVGPDAVTVVNADAVRDAEGRAAELLSRSSEILGKSVLTDSGDEFGRVMDVDFEPTTGAVVAVITTGGRIDGDRLIGCGSYAAVVRDDSPPSRTRAQGSS